MLTVTGLIILLINKVASQRAISIIVIISWFCQLVLKVAFEVLYGEEWRLDEQNAKTGHLRSVSQLTILVFLVFTSDLSLRQSCFIMVPVYVIGEIICLALRLQKGEEWDILVLDACALPIITMSICLSLYYSPK